MRILTAHQPSYLPWLGLLHKIALSDIFVILDEVQFEKNSFSNRNKIKGPNGEFWLTVPIHLKGHLESTIQQTKISENVPWAVKHLKAIENCYRKAPYFDCYIAFFRECYARFWTNLAELDEYMLKFFIQAFDIHVDVQKMTAADFQHKKADLVLALCQKYQADIYVFGALGKDYASAEDFERQGVKIHFQDYKHPHYAQLYGSFISHLSAVDLLFNHGPQAKDIMRQGNITKEALTHSLYPVSA